MAQKKQEQFKHFKQLKILYLFVFVLGAILILPTHIFPQPYFMYARFPHYLEMMKPFLGVGWPATFEIYHYILYALAIIGSINAIGIIFYSKLKKIAFISSFLGLTLISLIILFLFFVFVNVNFSTAIIYGLYFAVLLIVDFLTLKLLITTEQKEA